MLPPPQAALRSWPSSLKPLASSGWRDGIGVSPVGIGLVGVTSAWMGTAVIPGRPEGPDPESILPVRGYGFRARRRAAPRNDRYLLRSRPFNLKAPAADSARQWRACFARGPAAPTHRRRRDCGRR